MFDSGLKEMYLSCVSRSLTTKSKSVPSAVVPTLLNSISFFPSVGPKPPRLFVFRLVVVILNGVISPNFQTHSVVVVVEVVDVTELLVLVDVEELLVLVDLVVVLVLVLVLVLSVDVDVLVDEVVVAVDVLVLVLVVVVVGLVDVAFVVVDVVVENELLVVDVLEVVVVVVSHPLHVLSHSPGEI